MDRFTLPLREALTRRLGQRIRPGFVAALGCLLALTQPALASPELERGELYLRFKSAFEAGDWASAEERATALVRLIESNDKQSSRDLVNPLTNLGTVAYRRGNVDLAIDHYKRAIQLNLVINNLLNDRAIYWTTSTNGTATSALRPRDGNYNSPARETVPVGFGLKQPINFNVSASWRM